jgi:hypothetical protein
MFTIIMVAIVGFVGFVGFAAFAGNMTSSVIASWLCNMNTSRVGAELFSNSMLLPFKSR